MTNRRKEGYRYIRQYRLKDDTQRWALMERQDGRMRRVGTALSVREWLAFLFPGGFPESAVAIHEGRTP